MSVAFTSDAKPRWAAEWLSWPGFGKFWAQVVRHAMRKAEAKGVVVQVDHKDRHGRRHARRRSTRPASSSTTPTTELTVIDPQLGNAEARDDPDRPRPLPGRVRHAARRAPTTSSSPRSTGGQVLSQQSRGLAVGYPDELRLRPTNTGPAPVGRAGSRAAGSTRRPRRVFAAAANCRPRATPLWPYLVAAAALLFVADVALRRIDLARLAGDEFATDFRSPARPLDRTIVTKSCTGLSQCADGIARSRRSHVGPIPAENEGGAMTGADLSSGCRPVRRRQLGPRLTLGDGRSGCSSARSAGIGLGVWHWLAAGAGLAGPGGCAILLAGPLLGASLGLAPASAAGTRRRRPSTPRTGSRTAPPPRSTSSTRPQTSTLHAAADRRRRRTIWTTVEPADGRPVPHAPAPAVRARPRSPSRSALLCLAPGRAGGQGRARAAAARGRGPGRANRGGPEAARRARRRRANDKELEKLVEELREKVEELKQPGVDVTEALAKLSEMQAAIAAQQAQYNVGLVDAQLQSLGDAMVPADVARGRRQGLQRSEVRQGRREARDASSTRRSTARKPRPSRRS